MVASEDGLRAPGGHTCPVGLDLHGCGLCSAAPPVALLQAPPRGWLSSAGLGIAAGTAAASLASPEAPAASHPGDLYAKAAAVDSAVYSASWDCYPIG